MATEQRSDLGPESVRERRSKRARESGGRQSQDQERDRHETIGSDVRRSAATTVGLRHAGVSCNRRAASGMKLPSISGQVL